MADWPSMFNGTVSPEEAEDLLEASARELNEFVEAHPEGGDLLEILGRRLDGALTAETWDAVLESLGSYLGESVAFLVAWTARSESDELAQAEPHTTEEAFSLLVRVVALFGREFRDAYAVWNELPHNWRVLNREVYYDVISGRPHLRVRIDKFNGEQALIEGPADSILNLISKLIWTVRALESPEPFSPLIVEEFRGEVKELLAILDRGTTETGPGEAPPTTSQAAETASA